MFASIRQSAVGIAAKAATVLLVAVGASLLSVGLMGVLENKFIIALVGVFGLIVGAFLFRDKRAYGLLLFFFFLMVEGDIGLTLVRTFTDYDNEVLALHGRPPVTTLNLKIHPSDLMLFALMIPWMVRKLFNWRSISLSWVALLPLAYLFWAGLSLLLAAPNPWLGGALLVEQFKYLFMVLYLVDEYADDRRLRMVALVLISALAFQSVMALVSLKWQGVYDLLSIVQSNQGTANVSGSEHEAMLDASLDTDVKTRRAIGTMHNYATLGMFLNITLPFVLVRFLASLKGKVSWQYGMLTALGILAIAATMGRTAYVALAGALAFCVYYAWRTRLVSSRFFMITITTGLMLLVASTGILIDQYLLRTGTIEARLPLMEKAVDMIVERPLLGAGLNNHTSVKMSDYVADIAEEEVPTHNYYLVIASEVGIVGLALYLSFFVLVWKRGFSLLWSRDRETVTYALILLTATVSMAVQMLADTMFNYVPYAMLWFIVGLTLALHRSVQLKQTGADQ